MYFLRPVQQRLRMQLDCLSAFISMAGLRTQNDIAATGATPPSTLYCNQTLLNRLASLPPPLFLYSVFINMLTPTVNVSILVARKLAALSC